MNMDRQVTTAVGDEVCVTYFVHGQHIYHGHVVHHTDMSHATSDGSIYGERVPIWLTAEGIAERSEACLKRHLAQTSCVETNSTI